MRTKWLHISLSAMALAGTMAGSGLALAGSASASTTTARSPMAKVWLGPYGDDINDPINCVNASTHNTLPMADGCHFYPWEGPVDGIDQAPGWYFAVYE